MLKGVLAAAAVGGSMVLLGQTAAADDVQVEMRAIGAKGVGPVVGSVKAYDSAAGLVLEVELSEMLPGTHRFFVDDGNTCQQGQGGGEAILATYVESKDPRATLPVIEIMTDEDGALAYRKTLTAADLTVADLRGGTLAVVGAAENYRQQPRPAKGYRVACGAVAF